MNPLYCQKCGKKNEDDAKFCNSCGASLTGAKVDGNKEWENRCDEECSGRKQNGNFMYFWLVVIALIIVGVIFSIIVKLVQNTNMGMHVPTWMINFPYWDFCGLIIVLVLLLIVLSAIFRAMKRN
jgi:hypothetical protein